MAFGTWIPLHLFLLVKCKRTALKMRMGAGWFGLLDEIVIEICHLTWVFHPKKEEKRKRIEEFVKCFFLQGLF